LPNDQTFPCSSISGLLGAGPVGKWRRPFPRLLLDWSRTCDWPSSTPKPSGISHNAIASNPPTLMIVHKGREIARRSGAIPTATIVAWAQKCALSLMT
jgi:hypothetical protein